MPELKLLTLLLVKEKKNNSVVKLFSQSTTFPLCSPRNSDASVAQSSLPFYKIRPQTTLGYRQNKPGRLKLIFRERLSTRSSKPQFEATGGTHSRETQNRYNQQVHQRYGGTLRRPGEHKPPKPLHALL